MNATSRVRVWRRWKLVPATALVGLLMAACLEGGGPTGSDSDWTSYWTFNGILDSSAGDVPAPPFPPAAEADGRVELAAEPTCVDARSSVWLDLGELHPPPRVGPSNHVVTVNDEFLGSEGTAETVEDEDGVEVAYLLPPEPVAAFQVSASFHSFADSATLRTIVKLHNRGGQTEVATVRYAGYGPDTTMVTTSDGDEALTKSDRWIVNQFDYWDAIPTTTAFYGANAPVQPTEAGFGEVCEGEDTGNYFASTFEVPVPAGAARQLVFFTDMELAAFSDSGRAGSRLAPADVGSVVYDDPAAVASRFLSDLSAQDLGQIVNWNFDTTPVSTGDLDGDGIADREDNCVLTWNPSQANSDNSRSVATEVRGADGSLLTVAPAPHGDACEGDRLDTLANAGQTVTKGDDATGDDPVVVSVTSQRAGVISIAESDGPAVDITAPKNSPSRPLEIVFTLDESLGHGADVTVARDGVAIDACDAGVSGASPDPCVASVDSSGGDTVVTVRASKATSEFHTYVPGTYTFE